MELYLRYTNSISVKFFEQNPYYRTVHENWNLFKTTITDIIEKFVPSKVVKPNTDVPWLNI